MTNTKVFRPDWALEAQHIMLDMDITKRQLAHNLGVSYSHLCNVMNGYRVDPEDALKTQILKYLECLESGE